MKQHPHVNLPKVSLLAGILILSSSLACAQSVSGPAYASPETKEVIEKMVEAHGGMDTWEAAPTISYDNVFFNPFSTEGEDAYPWWVSHEVFEQGSRRAYQDWPLDNAQLTYDGQKVWTVNWGNGNMPKFMVQFFYYFVNLPWLTQDANVRLGEPGQSTLPGYGDKTFITVTMDFTEKPGVGKTARDGYKLYIDPDDYLLRGYEYRNGYGAMVDAFGLPPEVEFFGPMLRVHDAFTTVDGLTMPARFHTMPLDGSTTYGYHTIFNYSFDEPFDASRMTMPGDAVIDTSSHLRKAQ